jgi:Secretion system C-terminal sorting domain
MKRTFTFFALFFTILIFSVQPLRAERALEMAMFDAKADLVKIFPNPVVSDALIRIKEDVDLENSKVAIVFYNLIGVEVFQIQEIKDYDQKLSRDNFKSTGIYFYQLKVDDKIVSTGRITVK